MAKAFFGKSLDIHDPGFSHRPRWDTTAALKFMLHEDVRHEMEKENIVEGLLSRLPENSMRWDSLHRAQWLEMTTLLPGYILSSQGDRMLMAHSVEGRFPFLDCEVVDFSSQLPPKHKLFGLDEKHILKKASEDLLPASILQRPKQPYRAPDAASFFAHGPSEWMRELTSEAYIRKAGIFNPKVVNNLIKKCMHNRGVRMSNTDNMRIVAVLSAMLVHHHFIESDGRGDSSETPPGSLTAIVKTD
jgi:asparagine synthase (glutamine-hydrolysing)